MKSEKDPLCDVILIGGFLGAGKTTLLKNILNWPGDLSGTAILINEFGRIGIDGELLQGLKVPVYELTNGCICCTIQGDFHSSLVEIMDNFHPRRIFIDLLSGEDVPCSLQELKEINPSCSVVPTHHCQIDPEVLWEPAPEVDHEMSFHSPHLHADHGSAGEMGLVTFAFEDQSPFKKDCFQNFMEDLPLNLYRVNGPGWMRRAYEAGLCGLAGKRRPGCRGLTGMSEY